MYYKNTSRKSIVVNTVVGKVGIKSGEVVDVKYKLLPPISPNLKEVSQDEFISFQEKRKGIVETFVKVEEQVVPESKPVVPKDEVKEETIVETQQTETEIQDPGIIGFVNALINPDKEKEEALKVVETNPDDNISTLEQQIDDLKNVWKTTTSPRKKEKIGKQIKELQKQLKKLKK